MWFPDVVGYDKRTWVSEFGFVDSTLTTQYLAAMYWAVMSLLTVGYGDIHATNRWVEQREERIGHVWCCMSVVTLTEKMLLRVDMRCFSTSTLSSTCDLSVVLPRIVYPSPLLNNSSSIPLSLFVYSSTSTLCPFVYLYSVYSSASIPQPRAPLLSADYAWRFYVVRSGE